MHPLNSIIGGIATGALLASYGWLGWMPTAGAQNFPWPHDPGLPWVQTATPNELAVNQSTNGTIINGALHPAPQWTIASDLASRPLVIAHPVNTIDFWGAGDTPKVTIDTSTDPITVDTHGSTPDAAAKAFWAAVIGVYPATCGVGI